MHLDYVWAVTVAVAILALIGGPLTWAVGLRGLSSVALAPAFAVTILAGTAVIAPWLGLPWTILPPLVMTVVVATAIRLVRRAAGHRTAPRPRRRPDWWLVGSLVAAFLVVGWRVTQIVGDPQNISQTFDNIFHLNAVRFALDAGTASSLQVGLLTNPDGTLPFYPAAWHAMVALVVQLSGASIPVAVNALVLVIAAVVWPIGAVLLARTLFGRSPGVVVGASLMAVSVPAFPLLLMDYGVLYPLQLGFALLPAALAASAHLLRIVPRRGPVWWWLLILLGVVPGMTLAHPGAFVAWLALTAPMAIIYITSLLREPRTTLSRVGIALAAAAYVVIGALLVLILRPPAQARGWPISMSMPEAVWSVLSVSMWYQLSAVAAALAIVAGIVWAIVDRTPRALAAVGVYAVGALLFVVVASLPWTALRDAFTGSWYNNLPRVAAILAIAMGPIGAYGIARTWLAVRSSRIALPLRRSPAAVRTAAGVACALVAVVAFQGASTQRAVEWASTWYLVTDDAPLLSRDEAALLKRLPDVVPEGVAIAGSPWTGTSLAYALADRPVLMPHTLMSVGEEIAVVNEQLGQATPGSPACLAAEALGVGFVLDFGDRDIQPPHQEFPGLSDLATSAAVRLVDSEGDAKLYELIACG